MNNPIAGNDDRPKKSYGLAIAVVVIVAALGAGIFFGPALIKPSVSAGKLCSGVNIDFFGGGTPQDVFAKVVYAGALQAQSDLGANVNYIWSGWDSDKMVSQFKDAVAGLPDAIAMMGHPGASALGPLIDEAERKNIIVTMQNVDIPSVRTKYVSNGFGYVGQDVYGSGLLLGTGAVRKYNLKKGDESLVIGMFNKTGALADRARRTDGIVDGLKQVGVIVHTVDVPPEVAADYTSEISYQWFSTQINKYPNIKVLLVDHNGGVTPAVAADLKRMGKKPNELPYGGFDLSSDTIKYIKEGYIGLISDQQPYLQGYLPILQSCLTKKYKFAGLFVDTGVGLIDSSNVDAVANLAAKGVR